LLYALAAKRIHLTRDVYDDAPALRGRLGQAHRVLQLNCDRPAWIDSTLSIRVSTPYRSNSRQVPKQTPVRHSLAWLRGRRHFALIVRNRRGFIWVGGLLSAPLGRAWSRCRRHLAVVAAGATPASASSPSPQIPKRPNPRQAASRGCRTVLEFAHLGADSTVRSVTLHPSVGSAPSHGGLAPLEPPWPPSGCRPNASTARSRESRRRHAWRRAYRYKCGGGGGAGSPARIGLGHIHPT
jgi:hypothetical protein